QLTLAPNTADPIVNPLWSTAMKSDRICAACGTPFTPLSHIPHQRFCSAKACQRARRRAWQHQRMRVDPDYRENQIRAQASWRARCSDDEMHGGLLVPLQTWTCGRPVARWHLGSTSCATRLRQALQR
ncbi:hypothetical protein ACMZ49_21960, partial [Alcaligenes phenolicus]